MENFPYLTKPTSIDLFPIFTLGKITHCRFGKGKDYFYCFIIRNVVVLVHSDKSSYIYMQFTLIIFFSPINIKYLNTSTFHEIPNCKGKGWMLVLQVSKLVWG